MNAGEGGPIENMGWSRSVRGGLRGGRHNTRHQSPQATSHHTLTATTSPNASRHLSPSIRDHNHSFAGAL